MVGQVSFSSWPNFPFMLEYIHFALFPSQVSGKCEEVECINLFTFVPRTRMEMSCNLL